MPYRIRDHLAEIAALLPITCPIAIVIVFHLAGAA